MLDSTVTMQELSEECYPMSKLDGDVLAPLPTMPDSQKPLPVFAAQFNYVDGGALLCAAFHHSALDAVGFANVLKIWARYSRLQQQPNLDSNPTARYIQDVDLDRKQLKGSERAGEASEFPEYSILSPQPETAAGDAGTGKSYSLPDMTSAIFHFSTESLRELKHQVKSSMMPQKAEGTWVSANDALCALLWQRISLARFAPPLSSSSNAEENMPLPSHSMLGFAVNGRSKLSPPLSATYLGNVNLYGTSKLPLQQVLADNSLVDIALSIRRAVISIDNDRIQRTISFIEKLPDVSLVVPGFKNFLGPDLAITSWADLEVCDLDWGEALGGRAVNFRIPKAQFDGLCIILPQKADGGLEVVVGLRTMEMERLKADDVFMRFASIR